MENLLNMFLTIIGFVFMILLIVTVHEGGHLIAAKIFNVYCSEFSIGMGPQLYRKKNKETDFVIRALPIGGFCSMAGESEDGLEKRHEVDVPKERTIKGVARRKQIIIYLAGVTMNFITGFIVIVIACMTITVAVPEVKEISPGYPAENILQVGDIIQKVDGINLDDAEYLTIPDKEVSYEILRNDEIKEIKITSNKEGVIGIIFQQKQVSFKEALKKAPGIFKEFSLEIINGIKNLANNMTQISGIVGIAKFTSEAIADGWTVYLLLIALISINVGVFNLLPLPVMDGGRVVIAFIEMILGRDINKKFEKTIMLICAALLILLMVWAFGLDIARIFGWIN